eukprot:GILK01001786.1.p1 GENE.GILK01001786.1~~GILK01001786.1.p1  ORF type:complete len:274 (+),score=46.82 GILK01001786.1:55-876(+)
MSIDQVAALFDKFRRAVDTDPCNEVQCKDYLVQLKIQLSQLNAIPPVATTTSQRELLLARETLEYAALLSVKTRDLPAFERHVSQVKTFYQDFSNALPASDKQYPILGLNLLYLLANNRIAEFHTELELIPYAEHGNMYIKHPVALEQYIMEGNYNKVLAHRNDVPLPYYNYFMDMFLDTVRREIARSSERAYASLPIQEAVKMFMVSNADELKSFVQQQNTSMDDGSSTDVQWEIRGDTLYFIPVAQETMKVPSMKLIAQALSYATELERIV